MIISKKKHNAVVDSYEREIAALELWLREAHALAAERLVAALGDRLRREDAESALTTALAASKVTLDNADSALELALTKYAQATS